MRLVVLTTLFTLVVMATAGDSNLSSKPYYDVAEAPKHFNEFISKFNREYKDEADRKLHYQAFVKNLEKINESNKKNPHATFGINKFADYTEDEYKSMRGFRQN